jgi:hypothetical protein
MTLTVTSHFLPWNFERRLEYARKAEQTDKAVSFLLDITKRYRQYGHEMFLSEKQRNYLQALAVAGGWRPSMDREKPYYTEITHV